MYDNIFFNILILLIVLAGVYWLYLSYYKISYAETTLGKFYKKFRAEV